MFRISQGQQVSLRAHHRDQLSGRLADWLREVSPAAAALPEDALARLVAETIEFGDAYNLGSEESLRLLLRLRQQPDFPRMLTREHHNTLSRAGFSELERIAAFRRELAETPKLRPVTLEMDFVAARRGRA